MENDEALRLRISSDMKTELQKLAEQGNRKLSDYIRLELAKLVEEAKKAEKAKNKK